MAKTTPKSPQTPAPAPTPNPNYPSTIPGKKSGLGRGNTPKTKGK